MSATATAPTRTGCLACEGWGCERCLGGPGEQGFSLDEKRMFDLQDDNRRLRALVVDVEMHSRAGVSCPWCGGVKGQHAENCRAFSSAGTVR